MTTLRLLLGVGGAALFAASLARDIRAVQKGAVRWEVARNRMVAAGVGLIVYIASVVTTGM